MGFEKIERQGGFMPVPLRLINDKNYYAQESGRESFIDISILMEKIPLKETTSVKSNKRIVTAADKNATLLMKLWTQAQPKEDDTFSITADTDLSQRDILRLKTYGLVTGSSDSVQLTNRGKAVITVMTLGESNTFERSKKDKSYTEILANSDKKGKKGYRMPFGSLSHLIG